MERALHRPYQMCRICCLEACVAGFAEAESLLRPLHGVEDRGTGGRAHLASGAGASAAVVERGENDSGTGEGGGLAVLFSPPLDDVAGAWSCTSPCPFGEGRLFHQTLRSCLAISAYAR